MTDRELFQMALEALEEVRDAKILALELKPSYHNIISSLHARLAQPDLARVGEVGVWGEREWQGLTGDDINEIHSEIKVKGMGSYKTEDIYRAVEAKLKERNT